MTRVSESDFDAAVAADPRRYSLATLHFPAVLGPPARARDLLAAHGGEAGESLAGLAATGPGRARLARITEAVRGLFAPVVAAARAVVQDLTAPSPPPSPSPSPSPSPAPSPAPSSGSPGPVDSDSDGLGRDADSDDKPL